MNDFIILYNNDPEFKEFVDELLNSESELWKEYKILKTYDILISNKLDDDSLIYILDKIDLMISYFENKEQYEKCEFLKTIKNRK